LIDDKALSKFKPFLKIPPFACIEQILERDLSLNRFKV